MVHEATIEPVRPYSLTLSARMKSDATRYYRNGVLTVALGGPAGPVVGRVAQRPDGSLDVRLEGPAEGGARDAPLRPGRGR